MRDADGGGELAGEDDGESDGDGELAGDGGGDRLALLENEALAESAGDALDEPVLEGDGTSDGENESDGELAGDGGGDRLALLENEALAESAGDALDAPVFEGEPDEAALCAALGVALEPEPPVPPVPPPVSGRVCVALRDRNVSGT